MVYARNIHKRVGVETVTYVSNIYKYYVGYKLQQDRLAARAAAKQAIGKKKLQA